MRVWRWLAAAGLWLLAVAVAAAVAWFAFDSAGREVAGPGHAMSLVSAVQPSPAVATQPANVAPTAEPSPTTLGAPQPESGIDAGTRFGTPTGTPSVLGSDGGRTGAYSSVGGEVLVRCVSGGTAGWTARVADGWRVGQAAVKAGGLLRVLFVTGDGRIAGVDATCKSGTPSFSPTS
jgi:4-amino-4-deoxy-L-arabinose transferase-like glycosyltransferase